MLWVVWVVWVVATITATHGLAGWAGRGKETGKGAGKGRKVRIEEGDSQSLRASLQQAVKAAKAASSSSSSSSSMVLNPHPTTLAGRQPTLELSLDAMETMEGFSYFQEEEEEEEEEGW